MHNSYQCLLRGKLKNAGKTSWSHLHKTFSTSTLYSLVYKMYLIHLGWSGCRLVVVEVVDVTLREKCVYIIDK